jgi:DNA-binding XRE family transcriptional regulator
MRRPTDRAKTLSLFADSSVATLNRVLVNPVHVSKRLKQIRVDARLTQRALGDLVGMHREIVARLESGRHEPSLTTIERVCTACGRSVTDVFSGGA